MPNTPAAIGRGVTVSVPNKNVTPAQREMSEKLLSAIGSTAWVEDEDQMDAVTGVSGSGPAYVFYMIEALTEAGVKNGLPRELANQLARETVAGAGELARVQDTPVRQLRENVTSPHGTTAAGLEKLMNPDHGLEPLMEATVKAAADRSRELAKNA
ncbi:pyrroline-5-carboxylate reductase [Sneathiella glossodoripedis]|uniref:pyrroline-5-carboxylate reductase n=1 Tax=Sneathiella glossodoripedis TaxID=418853 RepID=UPI001900E047|nr:pyrroline-5-carboxylate reductase [Sneathiella glossodoripedis]